MEEELYFVRRQYANREKREARRRVWVHGKFRKPFPQQSPVDRLSDQTSGDIDHGHVDLPL